MREDLPRGSNISAQDRHNEIYENQLVPPIHEVFDFNNFLRISKKIIYTGIKSLGIRDLICAGKNTCRC